MPSKPLRRQRFSPNKEIISPCNPGLIPVEGVALGFRKFGMVRLPGPHVTAAAVPAHQRARSGILATKAEDKERCADFVSYAKGAAALDVERISYNAHAGRDLSRVANRSSAERRLGRDCKSIIATEACGIVSQKAALLRLQPHFLLTLGVSKLLRRCCGEKATAVEIFRPSGPRGARQGYCEGVQMFDYTAHTASEAARGSTAPVQGGSSVSLSGGMVDLKAPERARVRRRNVRTAPKNNSMSSSLLKHAHHSAARLEGSHRGANAEAVGHGAL